MRDGAALCQYLHWLGTQGAQVDEVDVADKAEYFRLDYYSTWRPSDLMLNAECLKMFIVLFTYS